MKLIKRIASYNFAVLFAAFSFFTAGYLLISNQGAEAATQSYTETYTVTKWLNCGREFEFNSPYQRITSVGPAEWAVSGRVGSTTFSETWVASNWKQTGVFLYTDPSSSNSYKCAVGSFNAGSLQPYTDVYSPGMYGIINIFDSQHLGGTMLPGTWTITGSITTP